MDLFEYQTIVTGGWTGLHAGYTGHLTWRYQAQWGLGGVAGMLWSLAAS
jgi:hypothetical protein